MSPVKRRKSGHAEKSLCPSEQLRPQSRMGQGPVRFPWFKILAGTLSENCIVGTIAADRRTASGCGFKKHAIIYCGIRQRRDFVIIK